MNDECRKYRDLILQGKAEWEHFRHFETCPACELWLQEHVNFRDIQISPTLPVSQSLGHPPCETFLSAISETEFPVDPGAASPPCPRCEETLETLNALHQVLRIHPRVSRSLRRRLIRLDSQKFSFVIQVFQVAAAFLLASFIVLLCTPVGKSGILMQKGRVTKKASIELSLAKAYLYQLYGEARGQLALTLAQHQPDKNKKEEKHEVSVSP